MNPKVYYNKKNKNRPMEGIWKNSQQNEELKGVGAGDAIMMQYVFPLI